MAVAKTANRSAGMHKADSVHIKQVKKSGGLFVKTTITSGQQKQEWFRDSECTLAITK